MATADLITSFLSNEMSPDQEREFLLSVASSDSMRLELKSHVMLDRILDSNARNAAVPSEVRSLIFAEAGIISAGAEQTTPTAATAARTAPAQRRLFSRLGRTALVLLLAIAGFASGYFAGDVNSAALGGDDDGRMPATSAGLEATTPSGSAPILTVPVPVFDLAEHAAEIPSPAEAEPATRPAAATGVAAPVVNRPSGPASRENRSNEPATATSSAAQTPSASQPASSPARASDGGNANRGASLIIEQGRRPTAEERNAQKNEE